MFRPTCEYTRNRGKLTVNLADLDGLYEMYIRTQVWEEMRANEPLICINGTNYDITHFPELSPSCNPIRGEATYLYIDRCWFYSRDGSLASKLKPIRENHEITALTAVWDWTLSQFDE